MTDFFARHRCPTSAHSVALLFVLSSQQRACQETDTFLVSSAPRPASRARATRCDAREKRARQCRTKYYGLLFPGVQIASLARRIARSGFLVSSESLFFECRELHPPPSLCGARLRSRARSNAYRGVANPLEFSHATQWLLARERGEGRRRGRRKEEVRGRGNWLKKIQSSRPSRALHPPVQALRLKSRVGTRQRIRGHARSSRRLEASQGRREKQLSKRRPLQC